MHSYIWNKGFLLGWCTADAQMMHRWCTTTFFPKWGESRRYPKNLECTTKMMHSCASADPQLMYSWCTADAHQHHGPSSDAPYWGGGIWQGAIYPWKQNNLGPLNRGLSVLGISMTGAKSPRIHFQVPLDSRDHRQKPSRNVLFF